jgi:hypothetical protein
MSTTTENCIEYEGGKENFTIFGKSSHSFFSYLSESKNFSYCRFLQLNQDTITASLTSLPVSSLILAK